MKNKLVPGYHNKRYTNLREQGSKLKVQGSKFLPARIVRRANRYHLLLDLDSGRPPNHFQFCALSYQKP